MTFEQMLRRAKGGDHEAITSILLMYRPLLLKYAVINGRFNGIGRAARSALENIFTDWISSFANKPLAIFSTSAPVRFFP